MLTQCCDFGVVRSIFTLTNFVDSHNREDIVSTLFQSTDGKCGSISWHYILVLIRFLENSPVEKKKCSYISRIWFLNDFNLERDLPVSYPIPRLQSTIKTWHPLQRDGIMSYIRHHQ